MRKRYDRQSNEAGLRDKIIGLGEKSLRKSYYPELQKKLVDLQRFKALLDQSNDAIFLIEVPSGRISDVTKSACRQIGYTEEECRSKTMFDMAPGKAEELDRLFSGNTETLVFDMTLPKSSGGETPYEVNMRRVRFGNEVYAVTIARDISRRTRTEKELKNAKVQAELYLDLMGHDINNINQIAMGFLELACNKLQVTGSLGIEDSELLSRPIESLKNSARLIENLRKIQKEKSGALKLEPIDINSLLIEVKDHFSPVPGRDITITFRPAGECHVRANKLLKDVFMNIVDNAVKYSRDPVIIGISTAIVTANGKKYCRVSVEDNGPGIADDRKASLFDFSSGVRQKIAGRGLGLYIVKTLVDDFEGDVRVEDRVPGDHTKGTRFVVTLPQARP